MRSKLCEKHQYREMNHQAGTSKLLRSSGTYICTYVQYAPNQREIKGCPFRILQESTTNNTV